MDFTPLKKRSSVGHLGDVRCQKNLRRVKVRGLLQIFNNLAHILFESKCPPEQTGLKMCFQSLL